MLHFNKSAANYKYKWQRKQAMKNLVKTLLILLSATCFLTGGEPILQLDTGGHTGLIKDIIITRSGDIISASDDKTIRVWDSKTGKEKRKILGQIGKGNEGKIFAIALSPNEEYLAVGGYFRKGHHHTRIYNYKTGKLIKLLKSHTNVVYDLAFDKDGKYLISGSADKTAKIWRVKDFKLLDTIQFHKKHIHGVGILKKGKRYFALTAGFDRKIALYDIKKRKVVKSDKKDYLLKDIAISKQHITLAGKGREIQIYDHSLKPVKTIFSDTSPSKVSYSPNGKFLIAGARKPPYSVNVYSVIDDYEMRSSFKKHKSLITAIAFLDLQTVVSGGANNNEIFIWNRDSNKENMKIQGVGKTVRSVGIKGDSIAWGNTRTKIKGKRKLQKTLNLKSFSLQDSAIDSGKYNRISTKQSEYTLRHKAGGQYAYSNAVLELKKRGRVVTSITKEATNGYGHFSYGFYEKYIISGAGNGHLTIYNKDGIEKAKLIGHSGTVMSLAVEGDRLVSGGNDQTIRVWDLSALSLQSSEKMVIYPMLNIFVSDNDEWVIWSKSGYFASSVNGDQYIGYHINQGLDKEAYFVSSSKYYNTLYRPDIIEAIVKTGSEEKAIASISKKNKIKKADIISEMPPILTLLSDSNPSVSSNNLIIDFAIKSNTAIEQLIVTRNGEKVATGIPDGAKANIEIELESGENIIAVRAKNKHALSDALIVRATKTISDALSRTSGKHQAIQGDSNRYKPTLYLLSIGVSDYQNDEYNLDVADKDAKSIVDMFQKQEGKIYKKVVTRELLNENADKDNILDALDWIERETTQRDMVIIFVAGHGINDDKGNYYFMAHDSDVNNLRRTALRWIEIKDTLSDLPSKVLLMVDTCHSGNILGQEKRRDITGAIKSIMNSGTGSVIMTASTGRGYSIENKSWGHGAFTKALLEGLDEAKADYNENEDITVKEIDLYITNRVKTLTQGKQKPTTIIPESIPDFAIGVK